MADKNQWRRIRQLLTGVPGGGAGQSALSLEQRGQMRDCLERCLAALDVELSKWHKA